MKVLVMHHNDNDGMAAAACVKPSYAGTDDLQIEYTRLSYGMDWDKKLERVEEYKPDCIFVLDFATSSAIQKELVRRTPWLESKEPTVHLIDHHEASGSTKNQGVDGVSYEVSMDYSGSELTWNYLHEGHEMPRAIRMLGEWDRWLHTSDNIAFNTMVNLIEPDHLDLNTEAGQDFWQSMIADDKGQTGFSAVDQLMMNGSIAVASKESYDRFIARKAFYVEDFHGYRTVFLNAVCHDSYVYKYIDSTIREEDPQLLIWFSSSWDQDDKLPKYTFSIRATPAWEGKVDCNALASSDFFDGGGGHKGAAGCVWHGENFYMELRDLGCRV